MDRRLLPTCAQKQYGNISFSALHVPKHSSISDQYNSDQLGKCATRTSCLLETFSHPPKTIYRLRAPSSHWSAAFNRVVRRFVSSIFAASLRMSAAVPFFIFSSDSTERFG